MAGVPHLKELSGSYRERGFEIVASTNEDPAKVTQWLAKNPVNYGVVAKAPGVSAYVGMGTGVPRGWVVSADGKIVFSGKPADITGPMVEQWLRDCPASKIETQLTRELGAAVKHYNSGRYGKALIEAEKLEASRDVGVATDAKFVADKVRKAIGWRQEEAKRMRENGRWTELVTLLEADSKAYDGLDYAKECQTEAKKVKATPEYKTCKAADEMLARITDSKELKGEAQVRELDKVIEKYPDTPAGRKAGVMKSQVKQQDGK